MSCKTEKQYWTPIDKFLLNVLEKHESLAMLCPRIQSPYDLITWNQIKDDNVMKFKYVRDLKSFYLAYLEKNDLMDFKFFFEGNSGEDPGNVYENAYNPRINDEHLMSHPPVFGHWLDKSGFISDKNKGHDHEFTYVEYLKLFDVNECKRNKTRKFLFPTFEAIREEVYNGNITDDNENPVMLAVNLFSPTETSCFNDASGAYDTFNFQGLEVYNLKTEIGESCRMSRRDPYFYVTEKCNVDGDSIYMIDYYNDMTFIYEKDVNMGFQKTQFKYAYHMNFDLNSEFSVKNYSPIQGLYNEGNVWSKFRKYGNMLKDEYISGRNKNHTLREYERIRNDTTIIDDSNELYRYLLMIPKDEKASPKEYAEFIEKYWKNLGSKDDVQSVKVKRDQCCYSSYKEYFGYSKAYQEIFNKPKSNYFWFMYGCLPLNDIMYEDLIKGLLTLSVFNDNDTTARWNISDRKQIFNSGAILPNDTNIEEVVNVYKQCIQFIGIVLNMNSVSGEFTEKINTYFISNSSSEIKESSRTYRLLDHWYPKITSSKRPKENKDSGTMASGVNVTGVITVADAKMKLADVNITESDKSIVTGLLDIMETHKQLARHDLNFLKSKQLLSEKSIKLFNEIKDKFDPNSEAYRAIIQDVEKNLSLLRQFLITPNKSLADIVIPKNIIDLDIKLRLSNNMNIDSNIIENIREICNIIFNLSTKIISRNMMKYLYAWQMISKDISTDLDLFMFTVNSKHYFKDMKNEIYVNMKKELNDIDIYDDTYYRSKLPSRPVADFETGRDEKKDGAKPNTTQVEKRKPPPDLKDQALKDWWTRENKRREDQAKQINSGGASTATSPKGGDGSKRNPKKKRR